LRIATSIPPARRSSASSAPRSSSRVTRNGASPPPKRRSTSSSASSPPERTDATISRTSSLTRGRGRDHGADLPRCRGGFSARDPQALKHAGGLRTSSMSAARSLCATGLVDQPRRRGQDLSRITRPFSRSVVPGRRQIDDALDQAGERASSTEPLTSTISTWRTRPLGPAARDPRVLGGDARDAEATERLFVGSSPPTVAKIMRHGPKPRSASS
jgi:hypothetical protein